MTQKAQAAAERGAVGKRFTEKEREQLIAALRDDVQQYPKAPIRARVERLRRSLERPDLSVKTVGRYLKELGEPFDPRAAYRALLREFLDPLGIKRPNRGSRNWAGGLRLKARGREDGRVRGQDGSEPGAGQTRVQSAAFGVRSTAFRTPAMTEGSQTNERGVGGLSDVEHGMVPSNQQSEEVTGRIVKARYLRNLPWKPEGAYQATFESKSYPWERWTEALPQGLVLVRLGPLVFIDDAEYRKLNDPMQRKLRPSLIRVDALADSSIARSDREPYTASMLIAMLQSDLAGKQVIVAGAGDARGSVLRQPTLRYH
jgi:hypothetical protein